MSIEFDSGKKISSLVTSTALGHSGRGLFPYYLLPSHRKVVELVKNLGLTVFAKSATLHPRKGNFIAYKPWTYRYVRRIPGTKTGMLNAYGLTNPGVITCAQKIKKSLEAGLEVIPNFYPEFDRGIDTAIGFTLEAIEIYKKILGPLFWALELNYSCPNSKEKIALNTQQALECSRKIREIYPWLIQIAKISIVHPYDFAEELATVVDVIHGINTIPYALIYDATSQPSPLANVGGGGVSGGPAKEKAYAYNKGLAERIKANVIFGCGIENEDDFFKYLDLGKFLPGCSVSLCSPIIRTPQTVSKLIEDNTMLV